MSKDKNGQEDIDLRGYESGDGLTLRKMHIGLWLSEKRSFFIRLTIGLLLAVSLFFFSYSAYNYYVYFSSGDPNAGQGNESVPLSPRQVNSDLAVEPAQVFRSGQSVDLAARIANPNDRFMATFDYCFSSTADVSCGSSFILPAEDKYILALGQSLPDGASGISFRLTAVSWRRVDLRQIPDWEAYRAERLNIAAADVEFRAGDLNSLSFKLTNDSPFSYYEVPLNILIYSGAELVGVNRFIANDLRADESRTVRLSWSGRLINPSWVQIVPDLNIIDPGAYRPYEGGPRN